MIGVMARAAVVTRGGSMVQGRPMVLTMGIQNFKL
jgi:hypothetical protein